MNPVNPLNPERIPVGDHTRAAAARVLEQSFGAVLVAVIEASGHDPEDGWSLVIDGLHLVKTGPPQTPPQRGTAFDEGVGDGKVAEAPLPAPPR